MLPELPHSNKSIKAFLGMSSHGLMIICPDRIIRTVDGKTQITVQTDVVVSQ